MKKLVLILLTVLSLHSLEAQTWHELEVGTTENLNKVYFVNDSAGFILGNNGLLLKTINGGNSWEILTLTVQHNLTAISFANEEVGFINGLKTTDGGTTWIPQVSSEDYGLLYAYTENRILAGHGTSFNGLIYESNDGGQSWDTIYNFGGLTMFNDCDFVNPNVGYVSSWYSGHLFNTTDAGVTWNELVIDEVDGNSWASDDFRSVAFPSQAIGLVTHQSGVLKTPDAGITWSEIKPAGINTGFYPQSILAPSTNRYILVGSGNTTPFEKIYETFDGGSSWVGSANTTENMSNVACSAVNCFAVGSNGTVYRKETTASISENPGEALIAIFPNPSKGVLNITYEEKVSEMRIYDLTGKLHDSFTNTDGAVEISQLNAGMYFLELVLENGGKIIAEFIKE